MCLLFYLPLQRSESAEYYEIYALIVGDQLLRGSYQKLIIRKTFVTIIDFVTVLTLLHFKILKKVENLSVAPECLILEPCKWIHSYLHYLWCFCFMKWPIIGNDKYSPIWVRVNDKYQMYLYYVNVLKTRICF